MTTLFAGRPRLKRGRQKRRRTGDMAAVVGVVLSVIFSVVLVAQTTTTTTTTTTTAAQKKPRFDPHYSSAPRMHNDDAIFVEEPPPSSPKVVTVTPSGGSSGTLSPEQFTRLWIADARDRRAAAYFNVAEATELGVVFEAYGRLRNASRSFFFLPGIPFTSLSKKDSLDDLTKRSPSKSFLVVAAVATDDSELCGGTPTFVDDEASALFQRDARLCLSCALADAAEPPDRRPKSASGARTLQSLMADIGKGGFSHDDDDQGGVFQEFSNPWRVAERELREAARLGSRAARAALARLVVVAAHFESRPTFLDDARKALDLFETSEGGLSTLLPGPGGSSTGGAAGPANAAGDSEDAAFAEAVAAGTRLAAKKASRLLAKECASDDADVEVVASAIAAGADLDSRTDSFGRATILQWAAYRGHADVVTALLAAGADPKLTNDDGLAPLDVVSDDRTRTVFEARGVVGGGKATTSVKSPLWSLWRRERRRQRQQKKKKKKKKQKTTTTTRGGDDDDETTTRRDSQVPPWFPPSLLDVAWGAPSQQQQKVTIFSIFVECCLSLAACVLYHYASPLCHRGFVAVRRPVSLFARSTRSLVSGLASSTRSVVARFFAGLWVGFGEFRDFALKAAAAARTRLTTRPSKGALDPPRRPNKRQPSPPRPTRREKTTHDIADTLATLDLAALSLETLDKLDELLPKLQRRVLKEVIDREKKDQSHSRDKDDDDDLANECVVCLARTRAVAFGCGHLCCCESCARDVIDCPVCRTPVASRHRIFNTT